MLNAFPFPVFLMLTLWLCAPALDVVHVVLPI